MPLNERHKGDATQEEFYDLAMKVEFPNEMGFALDVSEASGINQTFSLDGVNMLFEQMRNFALARLIAFYDERGKPGRRAHFVLSVQYFEEGEPSLPMRLQPRPFYEAWEKDNAVAMEVDGLRRAAPLDRLFD